MRTPACLSAAAFASMLFLATPLFAQDPPPPPPSSWTETASIGLALTSGNADTSTINAGYDLVFDPKEHNLVKSDGLFLRGKSEGQLNTDHLALNARDEYKLHDRSFAFGQVQFLRDRFKDIANLVAPAVGLGYRIDESARTKLSVDAGVGAIWEQRVGDTAEGSGVITFSEHLAQRVSATTTFTQSLSALTKTNNLTDSLYTFSAALAASVNSRIQLKVELLDSYKNLVELPTKKNDVTLIVGLVFKH